LIWRPNTTASATPPLGTAAGRGRRARLIDWIERLRHDVEPAKREPEAAEESDGRRDTVGALVEAMLITDAAYDEIVAAVRERFPEAGTTRRSVASVANAMRRLRAN